MFEVIPNSMFEPSYGSSSSYYPTSKSESSSSWFWVLIILALVGWVWWIFFKIIQKDSQESKKILKFDNMEVSPQNTF
jgi:cbb3-type cytochrome oxidase subunit 3